MQNMLIYFSFLFLEAFAVAGLYLFYMAVTGEGQIFGFMQKVLFRADRRMHTATKPGNRMLWTVIFKSLGGCEICTRQRLTEAVFIGVSLLWHVRRGHGAFYGMPLYLKIIFQIASLIVFIGMVTTWATLLKKNEETKAKKQTVFVDQEVKPKQ